MKIVLIGSGKVATRFARAFSSSGHSLLQVYSRTSKNAKALAKAYGAEHTNSLENILPNADLYFVALTDEATEFFIQNFNAGSSLIVHTSGSVPISSFHVKSKKHGVMYPMRSFNKNEKVKMNEISFFIEGNNQQTERGINKLALSFSKNVFKVNSKQRFAIHLAAVFANNFSNHMLVLSEKILKKEKLKLEILMPLIQQTFSKVLENGPSESQTGPAKRGDLKTLQAHINYLEGQSGLQKIYKLMSDSIMREK